MATTKNPPLSDIAESLMIPLYARAIESRRPDALLKDEQAVALIAQMDEEVARVEQGQVSEQVLLGMILRSREFDRRASDFLARNPESIVVQIGCGLDTRWGRVDNGKVEWYDLDLPEVIELRRKLMGGERTRYHLLACSVFDGAWLDAVSTDRPLLFLAEGVLMFFAEAQVKALVLTLRDRFPGAELVLDAFSPFFVWANNRRVARTGVGALCHWGLKHAKDIQNWGHGIRFLDEWFLFTCAEPRLARARWVRYIPLLAKTWGVFHYQLGKAIS